MYPETTPLIRDAIKRRYELIPYIYSLMLESHLRALPPQRWIGWGYESDPEVWTEEVMNGETQYWLGSTLLVGGVYKAGATDARIYLPGAEGDEGFLNLNEPYQHLKSRQWVVIKSEWRTSIPLLAKIGGALIVGRDVQTRAAGDHTHPSPNVVEDDFRAVELFPPRGISKLTYTNTWFEDDGISAKTNVSSFSVSYSSTDTNVRVEFVTGNGKYIPVWRTLYIILPVGDSRPVVVGGKTIDKVKDSRGRAVFKLPLD
jgi:alpha-glucosidase (family GH31 glycosyl hydrolase)